MNFAILQTLAVYLGLAFYMFSQSKRYVLSGKWKYVVIPIIVYSIVFGFRYMVGMDYFAYLRVYQDLLSSGENMLADRWELLFQYYSKLCAFVSLPASLWFGGIAFLQLYPMIWLFKKDKEAIPYLFLIFMLGGYWLMFATTLRHILAMALWMVSLKYIIDNNGRKHFFFVLLSILVHKSMLLILPLYFLYRKKNEYFNRVNLQVLLLIVSVCFMVFPIFGSIMKNIDQIAIILGYGEYLDLDTKDLIEGYSLGAGFFINFGLNLLIIINSVRIKDYFKNNLLNITYDLYFVGVLFRHIFIDSMIFSRLNTCFDNLSFVIIAYAMLYAKKNDQRLYWILFALMLIIFFAFMYRAETNTSLFIFNWQEGLFYLKKNFDI